MVSAVVYASLTLATIISFWSSLVEATYLTLRPFSLSGSMGNGSTRAATALEIVSEKTRLVSVTTFIDTFSNVVLATSIGLVLSDYFGPIGWVYSAIGGSFVIMILLYLLPKAIGIENALRMSLILAPSTKMLMSALAPLTVPLTNFARTLSEMLVGKPGYKEVDLAAEFEDVVSMLERAGHIEPDAGRLLRTALASSKVSAFDAITPTKDIVSIDSGATVLEALRSMGQTNHPRMPVYDAKRSMYIGAVTSRTISKAVSRDHIDMGIQEYMIQPARVSRDDGLATVIDKMQDAGATIAFVFDDDEMVGMITLSDIIERLLGVKV
ncbi:MAG TPA: CNNM domain-containing protein [Nitrososphaerales archaeon]|nr:CNNM domain-containing protein [Nitrososphaerales archaeon]